MCLPRATLRRQGHRASATLTRWALFNTDAATVEKYAELLSPASPAFAFPVPRFIPTAGQTSSLDPAALSKMW